MDTKGESSCYPNEFVRGLTADNSITPEGYVTAAGFQFDPYNPRRGDNYCELSVNWKDDDGAIERALSQHRPHCTEPQFRIGYAIVERKKVDLMLKTYADKLHFTYERHPVAGNANEDIEENKYHGNLLINESLDKQIKKNIQHSLATIAGLAVCR